jgi:hypothetical protein
MQSFFLQNHATSSLFEAGQSTASNDLSLYSEIDPELMYNFIEPTLTHDDINTADNSSNTQIVRNDGSQGEYVAHEPLQSNLWNRLIYDFTYKKRLELGYCENFVSWLVRFLVDQSTSTMLILSSET